MQAIVFCALLLSLNYVDQKAITKFNQLIVDVVTVDWEPPSLGITWLHVLATPRDVFSPIGRPGVEGH